MGMLANTIKKARYWNQEWEGGDSKRWVIMEPPEIKGDTHIKIGFFDLFLVSIGWYSENFVVIFFVSRICGSEIQQHENFMILYIVQIKTPVLVSLYLGRQFSGTLAYVLQYDTLGLRTFAPKTSHTQILFKLWLQVENDKIRLKT